MSYIGTKDVTKYSCLPLFCDTSWRLASRTGIS